MKGSEDELTEYRAAIEALEREPSEDGTLEVKVEDATKIGRVLISDDKHRGGLYYPDVDEPQGISFENDTKIKSCSKDSDLISRAEAIEALGEEPPVWCDEEYEIAERSQWRADIEAIESVPSADRPRGEWINTAPYIGVTILCVTNADITVLQDTTSVLTAVRI